MIQVPSKLVAHDEDEDLEETPNYISNSRRNAGTKYESIYLAGYQNNHDTIEVCEFDLNIFNSAYVALSPHTLQSFHMPLVPCTYSETKDVVIHSLVACWTCPGLLL